MVAGSRSVPGSPQQHRDQPAGAFLDGPGQFVLDPSRRRRVRRQHDQEPAARLETLEDTALPAVGRPDTVGGIPRLDAVLGEQVPSPGLSPGPVLASRVCCWARRAIVPVFMMNAHRAPGQVGQPRR
jgi:hypothetical protein